MDLNATLPQKMPGEDEATNNENDENLKKNTTESAKQKQEENVEPIGKEVRNQLNSS